MSIPAVRESIRNIVENRMPSEHPGLTLQRYNFEIDERGDHQERERLIGRMTADLPKKTFSLYRTGYDRWQNWLESDNVWSKSRALEARDRLFIGLGGASVLEFGITLHHVYGLPMIPGSALKGLAAHYADQVWGKADSDWKEGSQLHRIMFGNPDMGAQISAAAGAIDFLDAWWKPASKKSPFVTEIINPHHTDYYVAGGSHPPADWDTPIPVKMLAVAGTFLFGVRGPVHWNELALNLLTDALCDWGIGGKTRAGYGRFKKSAEQETAESRVVWDATLVYTPNNGTLTATNTKNQSEKAILTGGKEKAAEVVPEAYHNKLWGKRKKAVKANVEVEPLGNSFRILDIQ